VALVVITGGARSGKSKVAEHLAYERSQLGAGVVVVVFGHSASNTDLEFAERIARHQSARPAAFQTLEASGDMTWLEEADADALLVVDCLGTWLGRVMEEVWETLPTSETLHAADAARLPEGFETQCTARLDRAVDALARRTGDTIVVTNEVGDGLVPTHATGRLFRDLLGRANRALVASADAAYVVIAGRCVDLTALPSQASWPRD
jgi:adenosylcobinamide kinase / adenosylcobinamide-phosphate guanylyltransferase